MPVGEYGQQENNKPNAARKVSFADDHGQTLVKGTDALLHDTQQEHKHTVLLLNKLEWVCPSVTHEWSRLVPGASADPPKVHPPIAVRPVQFHEAHVRAHTHRQRTQYTLCGQVLVANVHFDKQLTVHFSSDSWRTRQRVTAYFHSTRGDAWDVFRFETVLSQVADVHLKAIYVTGAQPHKQFVDDNGGHGYLLKLRSSNDPPEAERPPKEPLKEVSEVMLYQDYATL